LDAREGDPGKERGWDGGDWRLLCGKLSLQVVLSFEGMTGKNGKEREISKYGNRE
jgi:hypothetical protein